MGTSLRHPRQSDTGKSRSILKQLAGEPPAPLCQSRTFLNEHGIVGACALRKGIAHNRNRNGVYCGAEGWLYWVGRKGEKQALYRRNLSNFIRSRRWSNVIKRRYEICASLNVDFFQVIIPDKLSVSDKLSAENVVDVSKSPIRKIYEIFSREHYSYCFINIIDLLSENREIARSNFLKTDTHTSYLGNKEIYKLLCRTFGCAPAENVLDGVLHHGQAMLDLGNKFDPPLFEDYIHYEFEKRAVRVFSNEINDIRENPLSTKKVNRGSNIVISNHDYHNCRKKIIIFGDSYSFVPSSFGEMLAENFYETHLIWSPAIDWSYVKKIKPDIVLCEIAERFTSSVPRDIH